jgi:ABC-type transport system involved in multi-copper enzyme maturation permease subunit
VIVSATREIFVKEIADSFLSRKAWMVMLLCGVSIPLSLLIHHRLQVEREHEQARLREEYRQTLQLLPSEYPDFAGRVPADELEVRVFRDSPKLTVFGAGLDRQLPAVVKLDVDGISVEAGQAESSDSTSLLGTVDLLFLVQFLLSLVAVVASFDMICGERETGTLKLILINNVSRRQVLRGKLASVLLLIFGSFTLALALGLGLLWLVGGWVPRESEGWLRLLGLCLLSLLYLGVFVHLGAWVSSLTSRGLTSLVVLLFVWAATTAILPQSAGLVAQALYPADSAVSLMQEKIHLREELRRQQLEELRPLAVREEYHELRREIASRYESRLQEETRRLEREHWQRRRRQAQLASVLSAVSPASALTFAWTSLTGNGPEDARNFFRDVDNYQDRLQATVFAGTFRDIFAAGQARGQIHLVDPREIPDFQLRSADLRSTLGTVWPHFALLVLFTLIPAAGTYIAFARYDVR